MTQVAATGAFLTQPASIRRGDGLWGRVWLTSSPCEEDGGDVTRIGAPLVREETVIGILGVARPVNKTEREHAAEVALVADLGTAALERFSGRGT
jgi:hypothetical protein